MGYNTFLNKLQAELGQTPSYVSTLLFDQSKSRPLVRPLEIGQPIARAVRLSTATYSLNGMTPLYNAIAETIRATNEVVAREKATRDFAEKSGCQKVAAMLEERKKRGWQIVFLAADLGMQGYQMSIGLSLDAE